MKIIPGPASQLLASRVAQQLGIQPTICEYRQFPDGEFYTRILDDGIDDVTIIQSTPQDSDLIALLQLIDACEEAPQINVVIPYMGYARQDKVFKPGEPVSARAIARTINADRVFTVNVHEQTVLEHFNADSFDLDASHLLGDYIRSLNLKDPLIIAPDAGALDLAETAATDVGVPYDYFEKTRHSGESVTIKDKEIDVVGKEVIIIDDMIATGGTMAESIRMLKEQGATEVYVACVHPVLTRNAVVRLYNAGVTDIISTDTLEKVQSKITVAPLIADAIKKL
ncbi:ribose-phosphate diphosphokinase [Methanohalophilus sp.]|uniref:ribose-phosphate diphosphokinase n=1 Tax=Methanohalophilus sp. TaxID=1966352 RepID=UPI00260FC85C|nr:ribose-phosphate diphosphokinase [Methanohalophilus sp.]MDK2892980.1 ribose-phosphate pyrophosphokinae [Methanohalophilus sp.]